MSEGFDNMESRTHYPAGDLPEESASVFQRRFLSTAETGATEEDGSSLSRDGSRRNSQKKPGTIRPWSGRALRLGSAIGALLLIIYLGTKVYQVYRVSPEQLYSETFHPYVLRPQGPADTGWSRFEVFYRQGSFDSIMRAARRRVILSEKETFIAGLAYLVADDPFWAIRQLKKLAGQKGLTYAPEAEFYLALAYLKNRDYDHALTQMLQIRRRPDHPYRDQFSDDFIERVKLLKWR